MSAMRIFFDVDYTILGLDDSLRPGTRRTFEILKEDGHEIYIWSGNGIRRREMELHDLQGFVTAYFEKPVERLTAAEWTRAVPVQPDLVVDDVRDVVSALGGIWVLPYFYQDDKDREMAVVCEIVRTYASTGTCQDHRFCPPPGRSG